MKIHIKNFPPDIIEYYNLNEKVTQDGYIFIRIKKGMYGLKQAALLGYENLVKNLKPHGYHPIPHTDGLWKHETHPITFCLCVDDFGVKYFKKSDVNHLIQSLHQHYDVSQDWSGKNFCGLTFDWHYAQQYVDISMPDYIKKLLQRFQHPTPSRPQLSPHEAAPYIPMKKGQRQYATYDTSAALNSKDTTKVQSIVGSLLYYARAIDNTILPALNTIGSEQSKPTNQTMKKCHRLLDYVATFPNVYLRFCASDMVLHIDSDAAYLVAPEAKSRIAGFYHLNSHDRTNLIHNGALLVECKSLRHVVASSAEAETAGLFHNAQTAIPIRYMLSQLGHKQPPTPLKTDNATALNFINNNITQRRSKSWDMRFYWLRDRQRKHEFDIFWKKSAENIADYHTKHHSTRHHQEVRSQYVWDRPVLNHTSISDTQGCVGVRIRTPAGRSDMTSLTQVRSDDVVGTRGLKGL